MAYVKNSAWVDAPSTTTPISAARLNKIETQYDEVISELNAQVTTGTGTIGSVIARKVEIYERAPGATVPSSVADGTLIFDTLSA